MLQSVWQYRVLNRTTRQMLFVIILAATWELIALTGYVPLSSSPRFSHVIQALIKRDFKRRGARENMVFSEFGGMGSWACHSFCSLGYCHGHVFADSIGMPWKHSWLSFTLYAGIAILPIVILWLGTGPRSISAVIWFAAVWPLIANLHTGLRSVPITQIEAGRNLGLQGVSLVRSVLIPGAFPHILSGLRVSWARAWQALVRFRDGLRGIRRRRRPRLVYIQKAVLHGSTRGIRRDDCHSSHRV